MRTYMSATSRFANLC